MAENVDKDIKALTDQINAELAKVTAIGDELRKEIAKKAPAERIEELIGKQVKAEKDVKTISDQLDAVQLSLKDKTFGQPVAHYNELYKLYKENKANLKKKGSFLDFEFKGNPHMLFKTLDEPTELSDSVADHEVIIPMRTPGVEKLPDRQVLLRDAVSQGVTNSTRVTWVERSARTEGTAPVAEDAQYALSNFTYIQNFAAVEKIGTYVKVTAESLEDWDQLLTEIQNELFPSLERQIENQTYQGNNTPPQLRGIIGVAGVYASTGMNTSVLNANTFDAIIAAGNQLEENNYVPNYAFMSPAIFNIAQCGKGVTGGGYLMPPFASSDKTYIGGMRSVKSNLMVAGSVLVGDFSKVTLYMRRGITIRLWDQDSTDPEFDRKTITASVRCAVKFPTVHQGNTGAFVYDQVSDITTAILAS